MTIRTIVQLGDPALRVGGPDVPAFDRKLWRLLDDMRETMRAAPGVGLAANQIGRRERVAVIEVAGNYYELIDPRIEELAGEQHDMEGCLSLRGYYAPVTRAQRAVASALDRRGKPYRLSGEGYLARAIQHEIDHLNGKIYVDHLASLDELVDTRDDPDGPISD